MERVGIRSAWETRPVTLRLFVAASLIAGAVSAILDPRTVGFPGVLFTMFSLFLLKKLWDGSAVVWWLFTISAGFGVTISAIAIPDHRLAWASLSTCGLSLALLVAPSTRSWFERQPVRPWQR